ncbi:hypothetical protein [Nocardioides plantarum]|uniref:Uncharacterized protein n=1 Tax=Nocardioides plantarum TaxID=29299 RepID=A0ABV5KDI5_9ACTN|nr:hypothetical protein [Nocardioides plantarum]
MPQAQGSAARATGPFSENVPRLLNRLQALAVAACLVFGVAAAVVQVLSWQAAGRAADNTEQVVLVQRIQSLLLRADAVATNSYLSDGLEPADARAEYDEAIDDVLRLITLAAEAQPADRNVLVELNQKVSAYTNAVSQARDYNRQQLPIGIAYLNEAGSTLRTEAQPILTALVDTNSARAEDEMHGQHPFWLLGLGLLALLVLFWANRQVAQRFRRRFNLGLVVAAAVVAVLAVVTAGHAVLKNNDDDATRDGAYTEAIEAATARTAANNAAAFDSLGLVNRGSGQSLYEPLYDAQSQLVLDNTDGELQQLWRAYDGVHDKIRGDDNDGRWNAAVATAISTDAQSPRARLASFDDAAAAVVDSAGQEASDGFRDGEILSIALAIITLLGAILAAGAATRGIDVRRREFS